MLGVLWKVSVINTDTILIINSNQLEFYKLSLVWTSAVGRVIQIAAPDNSPNRLKSVIMLIRKALTGEY